MNVLSLPFKGVRTGFRRAPLCAVRTGWLCKAQHCRDGVGMGYMPATSGNSCTEYPIPLPASPLKGEELMRAAYMRWP